MSDMRKFFEDRVQLFGERDWMARFMAAHGRDYQIGPQSFAGPRATPQNCYGNSTELMLRERLTYVEGHVCCYGVPIQHAWCVDADGAVVDPTIDNADGHLSNYYGAPFRTEYVLAATMRNKVYGLLDPYYARRTMPKLLELGLERGQAWLLEEGAPFRTEYVLAATMRNKVYGLLDPYYARRTMPKLLELGLERGQAWLLEEIVNEEEVG